MKRSFHIYILAALFTLSYSTLRSQFVFTRYDVYPGSNGSDPSNFMIMNGLLYFQAGMGLASTDGSIGNTTVYSSVYAQNLKVFNNKIYFTGSDGELWVSDGTASGTVLLKDIYAGANSSNPFGFTEMGGKLYFAATTFNGCELWVTDGTASGTVIVKDIYSGVGSSAPLNMAALNNKIYFSADEPTAGRELWISDGTAGGTMLLKDCNPGAGSSDPFFTRAAGGKIWFRGNANVWVSDGTPGGTIPLATSGDPNDFIDFDSAVYFAAYEGLYRSDGTPGGTVLIQPGAMDTASDLTIFNSKLYFALNGEPWVSDGTGPGTHILKDSICLTDYSRAREFTVLDTTLFFVASDLSLGGNQQLYYTDGTDAGTYMIMPPSISNINPLNYSYEYVVIDFGLGSEMYFKANYDTIGSELWKIGHGWVGIEENEPLDFKIGPNPAENLLNVYSTEDLSSATISIYTMEGKLLLRQYLNGTTSVDISVLPASVYMCSVQIKNREIFKKLIKL